MGADVGRRTPRQWRLAAKELGAFGVVGAIAFVVDLGLFQLLYTSVGASPVVARLGSSLVSMTIAFLGHRHWSFAHRAGTAAHREYLVFLVVNAATLALGLAAVAVAHRTFGVTNALMLQAVNVASIAAGTAIRFASYRRWVFTGDQNRRVECSPSKP